MRRAIRRQRTIVGRLQREVDRKASAIGAAVRLYEITGEPEYLRDAVKTANSVLTRPEVTSEGLLKDEGQGDGGLFKGILVRYLADLIEQPDLGEGERAEYAQFFRFNAETFYRRGLERPGLLSSPDWRTPPEGAVDFSTQLSGLMLIEATATLAEAELLE